MPEAMSCAWVDMISIQVKKKKKEKRKRSRPCILKKLNKAHYEHKVGTQRKKRKKEINKTEKKKKKMDWNWKTFSSKSHVSVASWLFCESRCLGRVPRLGAGKPTGTVLALASAVHCLNLCVLCVCPSTSTSTHHPVLFLQQVITTRCSSFLPQWQLPPRQDSILFSSRYVQSQKNVMAPSQALGT